MPDVVLADVVAGFSPRSSRGEFPDIRRSEVTEKLRICIDFHYALSRSRSARPSSRIPNENPSLVMSFRREPCELPNCWPSSSNANEKSSVVNEFSRKVIATSVIHNQMSRKLISNHQFRLEVHNTKQESLVHDWFSRIGNEMSAKLIRNAPFLIRCLENSSAIGHCQ